MFSEAGQVRHDAHVANLERFLAKLQSYPGILFQLKNIFSLYDVMKISCLILYGRKTNSDRSCKSTVAQGMLERCVKDKRYVAEQFQLVESSKVETQEAGREGDDDPDAADVFAPVSWLWDLIGRD